MILMYFLSEIQIYNLYFSKLNFKKIKKLVKNIGKHLQEKNLIFLTYLIIKYFKIV